MSISTAQCPDSDPAADAAAAGFAPERLHRLSETLAADTESGAIPGAVTLIVRNGRVALHEAVGYADRDALRPMRRDCLFRIASMTKPVTVVAALLLMERGKLLPSDPVWRFLPALRDVKVGVEAPDPGSGHRRLASQACHRPMTVHDLMRHTSGFTYGQYGDSLVQRAYRAAQMMDRHQTNAQMVEKLSQLPLAFQPGTTFEYGMSTDVLGHVVEVVSGRGLDEFFREHITGPLGMTDTSFGARPEAAQRLAEPHRPKGQAAAPSSDPARPAAWLSGGGGLVSTARDYARFTQMLLDAGELGGVRLLSRKSVELMTQNHLPVSLHHGPHTAELGIAAPLPEAGQGYGLGIGVRTAAGLAPVPGSVGDLHWGGVLGPYFWADPAERLSVTFMLQELNVQIRTRYRALLRALVYQALR